MTLKERLEELKQNPAKSTEKQIVDLFQEIHDQNLSEELFVQKFVKDLIEFGFVKNKGENNA
jgi:hypothetical protein